MNNTVQTEVSHWDAERWGGREPWQVIKRRGVHFDKPGRRSQTIDELREIGGLFIWEEVDGVGKRHLPFHLAKVEEWQSSGHLANIFYHLNGETLFDLSQLLLQLNARLKSSQKD